MGPGVSGEDKRGAFLRSWLLAEGMCGGSCSLSLATFIGLIGEEWKGVSQWGIVASFVSSSSFGVNAGRQALSFSHQGLPPLRLLVHFDAYLKFPLSVFKNHLRVCVCV